MTEAAWELAAEPGWSWVRVPVVLHGVDAQAEAVLDEIEALVDSRGVRAITVVVDTLVQGICADGGGPSFEATDAHRALIEQFGSPFVSTERLARAQNAAEWAARRLGADDPNRVRVRVLAQAPLGTGPVSELSLIRPAVVFYLLAPRDAEPPASWAAPLELDRAGF